MKRLLAAVQFLTKIPINVLQEEDFTPARMAGIFTLFPLVGLLLGVCLLGFDYLTGVVNPFLKNILLLSFYTLLTGGLHLDGYMDTLDGLLPAVSKEKRQEIMKESQIGAFAAIGLFILLFLKLGLFMELTGHSRHLALLLMPVLSRWSLIGAAFVFSSARADGLGYQFSQGIRGKNLFLSTLIALPITLLLGRRGLLLLLLVFTATLLWGRWITARIPGLTGDSYGFINEMNELLLLSLLLLNQSFLPY